MVTSRDKLDDIITDMAQYLLKKQFPSINVDLKITLLQHKKISKAQAEENELQIIHSRGDHWIVASTLFHPVLSKCIDCRTALAFGNPSIKFNHVQREQSVWKTDILSISILTV